MGYPSLPFPREGTLKFWGCTQGSLLLARIPCSNGGWLWCESLLCCCQEGFISVFFSAPSLGLYSLGWGLYLGRVPSSSPSPGLQLCEAGSGPRGGRLVKVPEGRPEAAGWPAVGAGPGHAGCVMPRRGCRGSFAAALGLRYCLPPSCTPHQSPPQPIPAVRPGCVSLP